MSAFLRSRTGVVLLAFVAIAAFFLITEHTAHVFGVLRTCYCSCARCCTSLCTTGTGDTPATTKGRSKASREVNGEFV